MRRAGGTSVAAVAFLGVGAGLRLWQLGDQAVLGDEMWSLQEALFRSPAWLIANHNGTSAVSAPLALWDWLMLRCCELDEWTLRAPVLAAGLAMLLPFWRFAQRRLDPTVGLVCAALVASSPFLVLYSRFARVYIGVALLSLLTLATWVSWLEQRRHAAGLASAACGALAIYLHPFAAPAILALWGAGLACDAWRSRRVAGRPWRPTALWLAAGTALVPILYLPSAEALLVGTRLRSGRAVLAVGDFWSSLHFLMGTSQNIVLAWLLFSAGLGALALARSRPPLAALLVPAVAGPFAAVWVMAPDLSEWSYVTGRYLAAALPALLLLASVGIVVQVRSLVASRTSRPRETAVAFACGCIAWLPFALGPLAPLYGGADAFMNHPDRYALPRLGEVEPPSAFYEFLSRSASPRKVVEAPWPRAYYATFYGLYQRHHGARVVLAGPDHLFGHETIRFRTVIPVSSLAGPELPADYVIVHRTPIRELDALGLPAHPARRRYRSFIQGDLAESVRRVEIACQRNPRLSIAYHDEWIRVYARGSKARRALRSWTESRAGVGDPTLETPAEPAS